MPMASSMAVPGGPTASITMAATVPATATRTPPPATGNRAAAVSNHRLNLGATETGKKARYGMRLPQKGMLRMARIDRWKMATTARKLRNQRRETMATRPAHSRTTVPMSISS